MTSPRPVLPGRTYLITRRCTQRQFLLRPDDKTNQVFLYCLGEAAVRFGIQLIAWTAMSNHYHAVVHDSSGRLPDFLAHFHKMAAKALNVRWSRWENLWSTEQPCATVLVDDRDVFDKVVYTLANPVVDHLVDRVDEWPGASSWRCHVTGQPLVVQRPRIFFREGGTMPQTVTLVAAEPPRAVDADKPLELDDWVSRVRAAIGRREQAARDERRRLGRRILGRREVRKASAFSAPETHAPRRNLRPTIGCRDVGRKVAALGMLKEFRRAYRRASERFAAGDRGVMFPAGTFALRRLGVSCQSTVAPLQRSGREAAAWATHPQ